MGKAMKRWLIGVGIALVVVPALAWCAFELWLRSSGDLEAVDTKAAQLGVPTTWIGVGLRAASPERLAIWHDLVELMKTLKSWQADSRDNTLGSWTRLPANLIAYHARLESSKIDRLNSLLEQLGSEPLLLHDHYAGVLVFDEIPVYKRIVGLLSERLLLAQHADLAASCDRMVRFIRTLPAQNALFGLVRTSLWSVALHDMALRMDDLRVLPDRENWSSSLLSFAQESIDHEGGIVVGEYLAARERLSDFGAYGSMLFAGVNVMSVRQRVFWQTCYRSGRSAALMDILDFTSLVRRHAAGPQMYQQYQALRAKAKHVFRGERGAPEAMILGSLYDMTLKAILENRVLALWTTVTVAEVNRAVWPIDPFDPGHAVVRSIHLEGRLIGAHCMGLDAGVQGTGAIRYCWGLYGSVNDLLKDD